MFVPAINPPRVKAMPAPITIEFKNAMINPHLTLAYKHLQRIETFPYIDKGEAFRLKHGDKERPTQEDNTNDE